MHEKYRYGGDVTVKGSGEIINNELYITLKYFNTDWRLKLELYYFYLQKIELFNYIKELNINDKKCNITRIGGSQNHHYYIYDFSCEQKLRPKKELVISIILSNTNSQKTIESPFDEIETKLAYKGARLSEGDFGNILNFHSYKVKIIQD